jgi:O-antigen/teichoic acid export membrane protein
VPSRLTSSRQSTGWRRSATAAGTYLSVVFGFLGTLVAARELGPHAFGLLAIVVAATSFFQTLLDLTAEEALVKYGYRYATGEDWGKLRRLFNRALAIKLLGGVLAAVALVIAAPFADGIFGGHGLKTPVLLAALLPIAQSPEGVASSALMVRGRYDVRAAYLAFSMALRLAGLAVGAHYGVTEAVVGIVLAQAVATAALAAIALAAFRRFPAAEHELLGPDRRGIFGFVLQSSVATGILSLRGALTPLLLGMVANPIQVGFFRVAQAPQAGFTALTSPVRLILLAEQTRDWERGESGAVFAGIRRYTLGAAALMAVAVPPLYVFMPEIVRGVYGAKYAGASDAGRLILLAGAALLLTGWSKSFPVSIGRPGLRILAHGIETAVLIPLVLVLGGVWDATGAAGAVLASSAVFSVVWGVLVVRIARAHTPAPAARREAVQT